MISRVVVLGGTGFLGRVAGSYARAAGLGVDLLGSKQVDLSKEGSLDAFHDRIDERTALLMAAAISRDAADDDASLGLNLLMAQQVARFIRERPPALLIYLSSVSVYGRSSSNLAITEETPVDLDSPYARAKHGGEEILRDCGVPTTLLRVCQVYGPSDTHHTYGPARFLDGIRKGRRVSLFGGGEELRDFLFEADFGRMIVRVVESKATGTFNLATGKSLRFAELVEQLKKVVPLPFEVIRVPRKVPLVHQGFEIAKLRERFPGMTFTPLDEGLRETWAGRGVQGKS